jgi:hypothetical protein
MKCNFSAYVRLECEQKDNMKGYITERTFFGHDDVVGFGDDDFYVKEISWELASKVIIENHYSRKTATQAITQINLGIYIDNKMLGVLQFGYAMNPASQASVVSDTAIDEYLELNRMWLDDLAIRNSESKAISYCIKYIKKKYPKIKWIQSFADERCGKFGIVYQAANFKYYGEHISIFWEFDGEIYHNSHITNSHRKSKNNLISKGFLEKAQKTALRQFRYIYFIKKGYEKKCLLKQQPYEKHYQLATEG